MTRINVIQHVLMATKILRSLTKTKKYVCPCTTEGTSYIVVAGGTRVIFYQTT